MNPRSQATPSAIAAAGMAVDIPATVLDALEEVLESTNNVVQEESATMPVEVPLGAWNELVGVPVVQMAGTDSDILSDTVTEPDSFGRIARQDRAESSDFNSVQAERGEHSATGDQEVSDSVWDENIVNRRIRTGFTSLDHVDLVTVQDEGISHEISSQILGWSVPVCNLSRVAGGRSRVRSGERSAFDQSLETLLAVAKECFSTNRGRFGEGEVERGSISLHGRWEELIVASRQCDEAADKAAVRRRRRQQGDTVEKRADRALDLVQMGELSAARHALESDPIAPGNQQTQRALQDPNRRPAVLRSPLPPAILNQVPEVEFDLSQEVLLANLRSSRRGAWGTQA